ncbi:hypothetical protein [Streptomyces celluloflavus]|uniref:Integrase n=1 Tax=Streptomyces celluloflavus TaxID=58344 RepID=A0ABW7R701_9ACTN|nr:hypothetical protein OG717_26695 [Streptomyces celluloflavus]
MSRGSRGGRRAAQPASDWAPVERLSANGTSVVFVEEASGLTKEFDFSTLLVAPAVQEWLAASLARQITARSGIKRVKSAENLFWVARSFATVLSEHPAPPMHPRDVTADHMLAFRARYEDIKSMGGYIAALRRLLKGDEELSEKAREGLRAIRVRKAAQEARDLEYTDAEWQQIMTAIRHDIRVARDRIHGGRELLSCFRAGDLPHGSQEEAVGRALDVFERTGDVPRYANGTQAFGAVKAGGLGAVSSLLCLSLNELTAFALLLTALTGQNFGTVTAWPAAHFRPDGGLTEDGLALVESVKPRRGPEREHMVVPLEDVLSGADSERRLFRSPLKVYLLLLDLGGTARRLGGLATLFAGHTASPGPHGGTRWASRPRAHHLVRWARDHGFPDAASAAAAGRPCVAARRLRTTVIERRRRPVAHSTRTMRETYLMPSKTVQAESRRVVADALDAEVNKARRQQGVPVFTTDLVHLAQTDLPAAAEVAGVEPQVLKHLLAGDQDTPLASCTDHTAGPHTPAGLPCTASFLACLDCENARALPHQLPVQLAAIDELQALRPHVEPQVWTVRFEPRIRQLHDIVHAFEPTERDKARDAITENQRELVRNLLEGRWDLR